MTAERESMRIMVLCDGFPPDHAGGAEIIASRLAQGYAAAGHQVMALAPIRPGRDAPLRYDDGAVSVQRVPMGGSPRLTHYRGLFNPKGIRAALDAAEAFRPDAVHVHNPHALLSYACIPALARRGIKVITTHHDAMAFDYGKCTQVVDLGDRTERPGRKSSHPGLWRVLREQHVKAPPFRAAWIRRSLLQGHACIAVSHALAAVLRENRVPCHHIIHNGIDIRPFQAAAPHPMLASLRQEGRPLFLFAGRLGHWKGGEHIIAALAEIRRTAPNATLVCACREDGAWGHYRRRAAEMGIADGLRCTGWLAPEDMPSIYAGVDAVAVPSLYLDPFPTVTLEAMAAGKPVVGTCFGGTQEAVEDGITGFVANPLNIPRFAERLGQLLTDPGLAAAMGAAGLRRIRDHFTLERQVAAYIDLLVQD